MRNCQAGSHRMTEPLRSNRRPQSDTTSEHDTFTPGYLDDSLVVGNLS